MIFVNKSSTINIIQLLQIGSKSSDRKHMKQAPNEYMEPIGDLISEIGELLGIVTHIKTSTQVLISNPLLLNRILTLPELLQRPDLVSNVNKLLDITNTTISRSKKIIENDFSKTNKQILVAMWNALLTAIENLQTKLLLKPEVKKDILNSAIIKGKWKSQLLEETDEEELRFFLKVWKTTGQNIVEHIENKLSYFDFSGYIDLNTKQKLIEMHSIRNCLVHRLGVVDKRTMDNVFSLDLKIGQQINISSNKLLHTLNLLS